MTFMDGPYDIILRIFSYLSQHDCLMCMSTCRDWYNRIPQYTENNWKTLRITRRDFYVVFNRQIRFIENKRRDKCLGKHVKNIIFDSFEDSYELYTIMDYLVELFCDEIESLEFINCCTYNDMDAFLELLGLLGSRRLTHLSFTDELSNISILQVLKTCPKLTHLTYDPQPEIWEEKEIFNGGEYISDDDVPKGGFVNLIYLHISTWVEKWSRLHQIFARCPNLQCFIGAKDDLTYEQSEIIASMFVSYNDLNMDIYQLLQYCPKLTHFISNSSYIMDDVDDIKKSIKPSNNSTSTKDGGFQHLSICEEFGQDRIARFLTANQQTLSNLWINRYNEFYEGRDWSSIFQSLELKQLRTLRIDTIVSSCRSLIALISHCPLLEAVRLYSFRTSFDQATVESLPTLSNVRHLDIIGALFTSGSALMTMLGTVPALERLTVRMAYIMFLKSAITTTNSLKKLEHLELVDIKYHNNNISNEEEEEETGRETEGNLSDNSITPTALSLHLGILCSIGSRLKTIRLQNVPKTTYQVLTKIAQNSPLLEHMYAILDDDLCMDDHGGPSRLFKALQATSLKKLELLYFPIFQPYAALDVLGKVSSLRTLWLDCSKISIRTLSMDTVKSPTMIINECGLPKLLQSNKKLEAKLTRVSYRIGDARPSTTLNGLLSQMNDSQYTVISKDVQHSFDYREESIAIKSSCNE